MLRVFLIVAVAAGLAAAVVGYTRVGGKIAADALCRSMRVIASDFYSFLTDGNLEVRKRAVRLILGVGLLPATDVQEVTLLRAVVEGQSEELPGNYQLQFPGSGLYLQSIINGTEARYRQSALRIILRNVSAPSPSLLDAIENFALRTEPRDIEKSIEAALYFSRFGRSTYPIAQRCAEMMNQSDLGDEVRAEAAYGFLKLATRSSRTGAELVLVEIARGWDKYAASRAIQLLAKVGGVLSEAAQVELVEAMDPNKLDGEKISWETFPELFRAIERGRITLTSPRAIELFETFAPSYEAGRGPAFDQVVQRLRASASSQCSLQGALTALQTARR